MKTIMLSKGKVALCDDKDYEWLSEWKWSAARRPEKNSVRWYAVRRETIRPKAHRTIAMHRAILGITDPKRQVDHENGDGLDNRRTNLREATPKQNQANRQKPIVCSSKHKGVCWDHSRNKWLSGIKVNQRRIYLGRFEAESDAALAYNAAATNHFGEFARLNIIT